MVLFLNQKIVINGEVSIIIYSIPLTSKNFSQIVEKMKESKEKMSKKRSSVLAENTMTNKITDEVKKHQGEIRTCAFIVDISYNSQDGEVLVSHSTFIGDKVIQRHYEQRREFRAFQESSYCSLNEKETVSPIIEEFSNQIENNKHIDKLMQKIAKNQNALDQKLKKLNGQYADKQNTGCSII